MDGVVGIASESFPGRCFGVRGNVMIGIKQRILGLRRRAKSDPTERKHYYELATSALRRRAMSLPPC